MVKHMSKPQAIAALYDYLNTIDVSGYDFKLERKKVLTPRYYEWIGQNQCIVSKFLATFCHRLQEVGHVPLNLKKGFKLPWMPRLESGGYNVNQTITIDKNALYEYYVGRMHKDGLHAKQKSNFNAAIVNMGLSCMENLRKSNGYPAWRFNILSMLNELKENGNVEAILNDPLSIQGV